MHAFGDHQMLTIAWTQGAWCPQLRLAFGPSVQLVNIGLCGVRRVDCSGQPHACAWGIMLVAILIYVGYS